MTKNIALALTAAGFAATATISYMVGHNAGKNLVIRIAQENLIKVMGDQLKEETTK